MLDDATIFKAMRQAAKHSGLICMHAENGGVIDVIVQQALAEGKTRAEVSRAHASDDRRSRSHFPRYRPRRKWPEPPSTSSISPATTRSKKSAKPATAASPPTLRRARNTYTSRSKIWTRPDLKARNTFSLRPLREKWNQEKLWQGLAKDTLQVVSTDHCPFCFKEQKELGKDDFTKIPNGGPGIEHRLSLVYTGGVHGKHFRRTASYSLFPPRRKTFRPLPRKGTSPSAPTHDVVIFDPNHEEASAPRLTTCAWTIPCSKASRSKAHPKPSSPGGRAVIDAGKFVGRPGAGPIPPPPNALRPLTVVETLPQLSFPNEVRDLLSCLPPYGRFCAPWKMCKTSTVSSLMRYATI